MRAEAEHFFKQANNRSDKENMPDLRRAAYCGHVDAQFKLGVMYMISIDWSCKYKKDSFKDENLMRKYRKLKYEPYSIACKWFRMAANQGHVEAQSRLDQLRDRWILDKPC